MRWVELYSKYICMNMLIWVNLSTYKHTNTHTQKKKKKKKKKKERKKERKLLFSVHKHRLLLVFCRNTLHLLHWHHCVHCRHSFRACSHRAHHRRLRCSNSVSRLHRGNIPTKFVQTLFCLADAYQILWTSNIIVRKCKFMRLKYAHPWAQQKKNIWEKYPYKSPTFCCRRVSSCCEFFHINSDLLLLKF